MSATNDACLRCHQAERAQFSMPYHHPVREGKMSCADCHDPHGGAAGDNLRMASVNQLCLSCHAQYRGPFAYQHPPVTEDCLLCHFPHGSPNTNLLEVSEPALCLQCHAGHHNGAGLPLTDRCTNCHISIHGTDVPTPSGGSRFVDKGPSERGLVLGKVAPVAGSAGHSALPASSTLAAARYGFPATVLGGAGGLVAMKSSRSVVAPLSGGAMGAQTGAPTGAGPGSFGVFSLTPGSYRFLDGTGFLGRVGEYDSLQQSAGGDFTSAYVSPSHHLTVVSRANVVTGDDYSAVAQLTLGEWLEAGVSQRGFVQQQDHYPFYAFPVLDIYPGSGGPPDTTTDSIPSGALFGVKRRLGDAYARFKVPRLPLHLFVKGSWQARVGTTQLSYLDENTTPAVYVDGVNITCGAQCHYNSQFQSVNYTTRNVSGGGEFNWHTIDLIVEHSYSSFNDRLIFPTGTFTGPFTPEVEGISVVNPPPVGPAPPDVPEGNYYIAIPSPSQFSSDRVSLNWTPSARLSFNGNVSYTRLRDMLTLYPQNLFDTDETLNWNPVNHLRATVDYHQHNLINDFTPYYSMYGDVSHHSHWEGLRLDYRLPRGFDVEAYYRRGGITRSNSFLWPQVYSMDNTDLSYVVPSTFSNTTGLALRYRDFRLWSARAGYEWTGTHDPGYLIVPQSNNRIFADVSVTPVGWLTFDNDLSIIVQNAFPSPALPNTPDQAPDFGAGISGLPPNFQRRNRFYYETASFTLPLRTNWNADLGYSYQQDNLTTYMAFQNDASVGYVLDQPLVPYKQITQAYWAGSNYTLEEHFGLVFRLTYNSSRSGFRPDLSPADAALFGNAALISQGGFDPVGFAAALSNLQFASTQISQVIVPQWIGQSKAFYLFPHKVEGGLVFYYGSYRDALNPGLNGVLRTFNVYIGRAW
jgi:predicted CXXCH cytochrome family protein